MQETRTCEICEIEFSYDRIRPQGRRRLFCSVECAKKKMLRQNVGYRKERRGRSKPRAAVHVRSCAVCGDPFRTRNARTVACGLECGGILAKRRGDAGRKAAALKRNVRTCRQCGSGFQRARGAPGFYCGRKCAADSKRLYATRSEAKAAERKRTRDRRTPGAVVTT